MPDLCYTATQVKFVRASILAMMGVSAIQAFTVMRLARDLRYGRLQYQKLHEGAQYLLNVLNENDIELTEFDVIALSAIIEGSNA